MTVIAITKFRPHHRKANLVLQNMKDVVSEFDKMGMTARISSKGTEGAELEDLHRAWLSIPA